MSALILGGGLALGVVPITQAQTPITNVENGEGDLRFEVNHNGSLLVPGERVDDGTENDSIPAEGAGTRMMWYPEKAAFRAGQVGFTSGTEDLWDASNVGVFSVAFGADTEASDISATAMGFQTIASGFTATAMGNGTIASGNQATAMGFGTTASGTNATATGSKAEAVHDGTFVWGDNTAGDFSSTGENQFLVRAGGGVGLGTNTPETQLDVDRNVSGGATVENHVAFFENQSISDGNVLALRTNAQKKAPGNFITFKDPTENIGAVEGNGTGGVEYKSGGGDFAELLPRRRPSEEIEPGEVVGVVDGAVTKSTTGAEQVSVVTDRAIVLGNDPGDEKRSRYEKVSFIGQVPVETRGPVDPGDLLVPSGQGDGTARPVAVSAYEPQADGPVIGQAWEASEGDVQRVNAVVGPAGQTRALRSVIERQQGQIEHLQEKTERIDKLSARVAELEKQEQNPLAAGHPTTRWGLGGLVLVGGLLLWRRRRSG